jgi:hypothetical protein
MSRRGLLRAAGISAGAAAVLAACGTPGHGSGSGAADITMFHWAGAQGTVPVRIGDAYAKAKGIKVNYIEGTNAGGGSTYVVGGLGDAFASGIPVLVISSDIHADSRGSGALTEIDQCALFSAVTKAQIVDDPPVARTGHGLGRGPRHAHAERRRLLDAVRRRS